ncbi:hypothetical protein JCM11251_004443 [Rhodosporidiobolus azoricus]
MSGLLNLPGTKSGQQGGYVPLGTPLKQHAVSAGGIAEPVIEMGDLGLDEFYNDVASIRDSIRTFDDSLSALRTKQLYSLQNPSEELSVELNELSASLTLDSAKLKARLTDLGKGVGQDEARRGHWENLKAQLGRAVQKWQTGEMQQREKVRERVARQMAIVNPDVTEAEIKAVVDTSSASSAPQIFQQAVSGTRTAAATSALNDVKSRHSELLAIETTLVELAALMQQVAELVITQDTQFTFIEDSTKSAAADIEAGVQQVAKARLSAAAARHKRKICFGVAAVLVIILIVVILVQLGGSGGGASKEETKTETVSATDSHTANQQTDAATATATQQTQWWTPEVAAATQR